MAGYRNDPFINLDGIQKLQQELGKLFEGEWVKPSARQDVDGNWIPSMDSLSSENSYQFLLDLPGVALDAVNVSVHRGVLTISGSRTGVVDSNFGQQERPSGAFSRSITLPDDVQEDSCAARMDNGVLTITVNRSQVTPARTIPVNHPS